MEKYGSYYQLLDELRMTKGMSIHDLCDGIISDRTYLRLMKNGSKVNFTTFSRLLNKLDIKLGQFMTYMIQLDKKDYDVNHFTLSVHLAHFKDIKPIYERIYQFKSDNQIETLSVQAFILVYQYKVNKLDKQSFKIAYQAILNDLVMHHSDNLLVNLIKFMYHMYFTEDALVDYHSFGYMLLNYNSTLSVFYYIMLMDMYLGFVSQVKNLDIELYTKVLDKFEKYVGYIHIKNYVCNLHTYRAIIHHANNHIKLRNQQLYQAFMHAVIIHSQEAHKAYQAKITQMFNIDIQQFLIDESINYL